LTKRYLPALAALAALTVPAVTAPAASAGTYTVDADTSVELDGWSTMVHPGFFTCSRAQRPGVCSDPDVPADTPLRVLAKGDAAGQAYGAWTWAAPPTVTIAAGDVDVDWRTANGHAVVYLKAQLANERWSDSPRLFESTTNGVAQWRIPAGNQEFGVFLKTEAPTSFDEKWNNTLAVSRLVATLRDDTAPAVALDGPLAAGTWQRSAQPVCVAVDATDVGAGVAALSLTGPGGTAFDSHAVPRQSERQPGLVHVRHELCTTPAALGDGAHDLVVTVRDAAGETTSVPLRVSVDANAPDAIELAPAGSTIDRRPLVGFAVDAGPSGLASFAATLDGEPMQIADGRASLRPAADLAYGEHRVVWHATDRAGNERDGFWTFRVVDPSPPVLSEAAPAAGDRTEERRPRLAFRLVDDGTGVDPASLRVVLDGVDVAAAGTFADGIFTFTPAPLAFGAHAVRVLAADRSGNAMPAHEWTFTVADATPPALASPRPDAGSSGADRTPPISVLVDDGDGTGVGADGIELLLDGAPVAAGDLGGGRFGAVPAAPFAYGTHTVSARATDAAGNVSAPLVWSFTVRDEVAPAISAKLPAPGAVVVGATPIGFDVDDLGVGVDAGSLVVTVDGSDVTEWGTVAGGRFRYEPGNLGAGVHTIAVTVADRAGNVTGPVLWQFAVANPATLDVRAAGGAGTITAGARTMLRFVVRSGGEPLAGARVRVAARTAGAAAYGPERTLVASPGGVVRFAAGPVRTTTYRVRLAADESVSATRTVVVRRAVTLAASRSSARRGHALRLAGRVRPAGGASVRLELLTRNGWRRVAAPRVAAGGRFSALVVPRVAGRYVFRAVTRATAANAQGVSRLVTVRVR
jgi:hypothetical protein